MNKTVCKNLSNVLPTKKKLQVIEIPGAASTHYSLPVNFKFLISLSLEKFSQIHAKTLRNYDIILPKLW